MKPKILFTLVAVAAMACGDGGFTSPRETQTALPHVPAPGALMEFTGVVEASGEDLAPAYLRTSTERLALQGPEASVLANLANAEVRVRGSMDGAAGMFVQSFRVLLVKGRVVVDGRIETMDGSLALRLDDGTIYPLLDAPEGIAQHLGARIWFAPQLGALPAAFGVIVE
jgi:hypothetical protein